MTTDSTDVVQAEQVSTETASEAPESQAQPSELDALQTQIQDAVKAQLAEESEKLRRQYQSQSDQSVARETRKLQAEAAQRLKVASDRLHEADPDAAREFQSQTEREELAGYRQREETRLKAEEGTKTLDAYYGSLGEHLKALGISSDDTRVDWGNEFNGLAPAKDLTEVNTRFLSSVAKIQTEERAKMTPNESEIESRIEAKLKASLGIKVDVNGPSGGTTSAEWYDSFTQGREPNTPENMKRAETEHARRLAEQTEK